MQTLDLGNINKPLLIFGGSYSNLQATQAMQKYCTRHGYTPEQVIFTGDCVAYCASPEQTIQLIRDWGIHCIAGNVEIQLANEADDCGCNFIRDSVCDVLSVTWYDFINKNISLASRAWMRDLPLHIRFRMNNKIFKVVHGASTETAKFIYPSTAWHIKSAELNHAGVDVIVAGHSGIPFIEQQTEGGWINAGVIGMPANDGTADGWFMTLTPSDGHISCESHRLQYNAELAAYTMEQASLATEYGRALLTGIWPGQEILPDAERAQQGSPLATQHVIL